MLLRLEIYYYIVAPFIGILAGFIGTLLGIGGGSIMVPFLVLLGVSAKEAIPASLFAILGTSLGGLRRLFKEKLVDYKLAFLLESASVTGAILGVIIFGKVSNDFLVILLGAVLIASGGLFIIKERSGRSGRGISSLREYGYLKLFIAWIASLAAGFLSATLGIGGGVVKVPILVLIVGLTIHTAVSTSKLMVGITALAGVLGHIVAGRVDYILALALLAGTYLGASLSAKILIRLRPKIIMIIASSYYVVTGLSLIIKVIH